MPVSACSQFAFRLAIIAIAVLSSCTANLAAQENANSENGQVDFAHEILPVLKKRCAECHSNGVFKGGLSIETRELLMDSGAVESGDAKASDLFDRITSDDPDFRMPPEGDRLSKSEINSIRKWIDNGVKWPVELTLKQKSFARPLSLSAAQPPVSKKGSAHPVDRFIESYFDSRSIKPPTRLTDVQFFRRAKLDLLGQLPTAEELAAIEKGELTRGAMIDQLLARDQDYANHWLSFWNDLLRNDYVGTGYIDGGRKQITGWLHRSLMENKPYDQFVRELIAPTPESDGFIKGIKWRGKVNASQVRPLQFSQNISQVFLGINMKCASCHDSFIDEWKLDDAYGLAAIISEKPLELHRCDVPTGKMAVSKFVFPGLGEIDPQLNREERLKRLSELMTTPNNGRFSRTIVNRIWHRLAGRGLVHPVDVMAGEAWSEPLLDYLANDLVANGYDLKKTMKLIATTSIYQSQAVNVRADENAEFIFQGVQAKKMTAEQFVDAIWQLTDVRPKSIDAKITLSEEGQKGRAAVGKWIWSKENFVQAAAGEEIVFRYLQDIETVPEIAKAVVTCDNSFQIFVNGRSVGKGNDWTSPQIANLKPALHVGKNTILIRAKNGGDAPNPAALFCEIVLKTGKDIKQIGSDNQWDWTVDRVTNGGAKAKEDQGSVTWKAAIELAVSQLPYQSVQAKINQRLAQAESGFVSAARASLIKSNPLMRSLGRPNREQVVTTRPANLSTLQALDLSNGQILSDWLNRGATKWVAEMKQKSWTNEQLIENLYWQSLSRKPNAKELQIISLQQDDLQRSVEDLLWMLTMLPEFQFVK